MQVYGYTQGLDAGSGLHGGYGEYMEIRPNTHLIPLTESVPAEELSLFEPLANVVNWFDRVDVHPGETVVIQGPGHMGLIGAAYAKYLGAGTVIVTGRSTDRVRLDGALALGVDHTVDVDAQDPVAAVAELTDGRLADVAVDLTDAPVTVGSALEMAGMGGRVLWAGLKNMAPVSVLSDLVPLKGLTVFGGAGSTGPSMEKAAAILNAGAFPTAALRGEVFSLDSIDDAMALLERRDPDRDAVRVGLSHA
jgi:threonine dehydrogenase-like Zn-dependent dehydrogenase